MIELGQLRCWKEDVEFGNSTRRDIFLVSNHIGKFYPQGARHLTLEDHWDIMVGGAIHSGWSSSLLEELSEAVHGAQ